MDKKEFGQQSKQIIGENLDNNELARKLEKLWLKGEKKSTALITEELKGKIKYKGIDLAVLKTIGQTIGKQATKDVPRYIELSEILWNAYGVEGRIVTAHILSYLNEKDPENILALCMKLLESTVTWGECDNMAYAVEPIFRKDPENYLHQLKDWLANDNKWIKRAALNVIARLPMKQPKFTRQALELIAPCLEYDDNDVRRTCSFAIRMSARGDKQATYSFISENIGGSDYTKTWIFCDTIRSMTKSFLPEFKGLLPLYEEWHSKTTDAKSKKSLEAAIKVLLII